MVSTLRHSGATLYLPVDGGAGAASNFSLIWSTTDGSASVDRSPSWSPSPAEILRCLRCHHFAGQLRSFHKSRPKEEQTHKDSTHDLSRASLHRRSVIAIAWSVSEKNLCRKGFKSGGSPGEDQTRGRSASAPQTDRSSCGLAAPTP